MASPPKARICCLLAGGLHSVDDNIIDPGNLGHHTQSGSHLAGGGATGLMYFRQLGIIDFGHLRDLCDLTKYVYDLLVVACSGAVARRADGAPGTCTLNANARIQTPNGHTDITSPLTADDLMPVARSIAYDDAVGYEIDTYFGFLSLAHHTSSFSPEDLPSNYLGTWVCAKAHEQAVANKSKFDDEVDAVLKKLCKDFEAQPKSTTLHVFDKYIKGRWVAADGNYASSRYLRRRNFTGNYWDPLIDHPGYTPFDASGTSQGLATGKSLDAYASKYRFTLHSNPPVARDKYPDKIESIRKHAKATYGEHYDSPSTPGSPVPPPPKPVEDRTWKDREHRQSRVEEEFNGSRRGAQDQLGGADRYAASDTLPPDGGSSDRQVEQEA